jgi:hypothetical protein
MKKSTTLILTSLLAAASFGATSSTTLPTTTQAYAATPAPTTNPYLALRGMSADYLVLTHRSIFKKGSQTTDPFAPTTPVLPPAPIRTVAESSLEFNGAMHADASWTAFFENTSSHDVFVKHEGDIIARGKITAITLDSIDYETNGRQNTIALGHTLDGSEGPGLASAPSLSLSSTQPSANFTGPNAEVLERLRQKRLKELGQ